MFYWWSKCSTRLLCARSSENRCVRMIWWRRRLLDPISSGGCDSAAKNIIVGVLLLYVLLDLVCASFSMTHRLLTSGVTCFWVPVNRKRKGNPAVMNTGPKSTRWDLWVRKAFYRLLLSYRASHATRMMLEKKRCWLFIFLFSQVSREGVDVSDYVTDWISPLSIPPLCAPFAPITSLFAIPARLLLRDDAFHINIHWFVEIGALTHFCLQNFNLAEPLFSLV